MIFLLDHPIYSFIEKINNEENLGKFWGKKTHRSRGNGVSVQLLMRFESSFMEDRLLGYKWTNQVGWQWLPTLFLFDLQFGYQGSLNVFLKIVWLVEPSFIKVYQFQNCFGGTVFLGAVQCGSQFSAVHGSILNIPSDQEVLLIWWRVIDSREFWRNEN